MSGTVGVRIFLNVFLMGFKHFSCNWKLVWRASGSDVENYLINNDSLVLTQRIILRPFNINRKNIVPSRNYVRVWVTTFREKRLPPKKNSPGREASIRTPENFERGCQVLSEISRLLTSRYAITLRISDRTVRRILPEELNTHSYKIFMFKQ
jgi:hypothetical protein